MPNYGYMSVATPQKKIHDSVASATSCPLSQVAIHPLGQHAQYFGFNRDEDAIHIQPRNALPQRCSIRPMGIFQNSRGYPEACTAMGRLHFSSGMTEPLEYRAFTHDSERCLKELFFPAEASPYDDDWMPSVQRWRNWETVTKHLLHRTNIDWAGLCDDDIDQLLQFQSWTEPIEPCVHHALAQTFHDRGECVIEVGSLQGRSASIFAMALQGVGSDAPIISIDPHSDQPCNLDHVRVSLSQIGQQRRLIQMPYTSDQAGQWIRPESASLIYIDGDHTYSPVVSDIEIYCDLLAPGGCIAFHDYGFGKHNGQPDPHPDVRRAVDELMFGSDKFRPLLLSHVLMVFVKEGR